MRHEFNMVEIVVALVVTLVALLGIMSLIPAGIEVSDDAINREAAGHGADQFLSHMTARVEADWTQLDPLPLSAPGEDGRGAVWGSPLYDDGSLSIRPEMSNEADAYGPETPCAGVFLLRQSSGVADDFTAVLRVWKEELEVGADEGAEQTKGGKKVNDQSWERGNKVVVAHHPPGRGGAKCVTLLVGRPAWESGHANHPYDHLGPCDEDVGPDGGLTPRAELAAIVVELSWPVQAPLARRTRVVYRAEVAKPVAW